MKASDLQVGIGVDLSELTNGLKKVSSQLDGFSKKTANDAREVGDSWGNNLGNIVKGFISLELASRGLSAIKSVFLLEERFNALKMPLKNVTEATGDYGVALTFITKLADQTGQDLFVLGDSYKGLYASAKQAGLATTEIHNIFSAIVRSGSALKLSNEQVSLSLKAVEQMMNKGTISSEELKGQLGEQLPGAYAMMAKAAQDAGLSVSGSTQELGKLLDEGKVASAEVLPFFAKRMEEAFGKNADANINTISGSANRLKNEFVLLVDALDDSKVTSFWASVQNGIADTFKDLKYLVNSGSFKNFMSYVGGQSILVTGARIGQEAQDKSFTERSPKEQAKIYRELNIQLQQTVKNSRDLLKAGITPNTEAMTKLADQVRRYKDLMSPQGGGSTPKKGGLVSEGERKAVQDYTFDIALLEVEIKRGMQRLKEWQAAQELAAMKTIKFDAKPIDFTMSRSADMASKDRDLINQLFGGDLEASTKRLSDRFDSIKNNVKVDVEKFTTDIGKWISKNFKVLQGITSTMVGGLADILATGLGNMFNQNVKFDPKKMIGQVLESVGQMLISIAAPLVAALALGNVATMGGMSVQWGAALGMLGAGIAMKGGGMALSSDSVGSSYGSGTTNARSYTPYTNSTQMQTVEVRFANGALKGYIDNRSKKYNG